MELSVPVGVQIPPKPTPAEPRGNIPIIGYPSPAIVDRPMRVLVADDHKLFRMGFVQLLAQEPTLNVIGEAADGNQAVQLARQLKPDVLILDVSMPGLNGIQVAAQVSRELPLTRIVGLSMHEDSVMAKAMYDAGVTAYLNKGVSPEEILSVLRSFTTMKSPQA